ncbi:hypothetical protein RB195_023191 [Necator americanus]|uniref:GSKIP domain-containing protein n=1 Tax=Necator americanus TaxID=51031 RepID=A0ABR1EI67_NECAM
MPHPDLSQKLSSPSLEQFRVTAVDQLHLTITSVSFPQSTPRKVHTNQVKKCFEFSEGRALAVVQAVEQDVFGYRDELVSKLQLELMLLRTSYNARFRSRRNSV